MEKLRSYWFQQSWFYIKGILLVNAIFLIISLFWRVAFMFKFGDLKELNALTLDVLKAFVLGARFDGTVLFYINALPLLILLVASLFSFHAVFSKGLHSFFINFHRFLKPYYTVMLTVVTFIYAVDFGFYGYFQDRINILVFGFIADDTAVVTKGIWKDYPVIWIFLGLFTLIYLVYKGLHFIFVSKNNFKMSYNTHINKHDNNKDPKNLKQILNYPQFILFFFIIFIFNGVGARGSLGLFPLSEMDTGISKSIFVNQLSFNGVHAFSRAIKLKNKQNSKWNSNLDLYGYSENYLQALSDFYEVPIEKLPADPFNLSKKTTPKNEWLEKNKPHVVVLVMEGMGADWFKYNQPEFDLVGDLKDHLNNDNHITSFISANNGTIGSLTSIMTGTTLRPMSPFLNESEYMQVLIKSSPSYVFKQAGYETRFLYGGNPGWREINEFAARQSFDFIEGEDDVEKSLGGLKEKHDWGIFDEDFFNHILKTLNEAQASQFILGMSTTNHPPYQLPSSYQIPPLEIPDKLKSSLIVDIATAQKRFNTYRYANEKVAEFITAIKNSDLKDKVIIAVTGDHNFWMIHYSEKELMKKYAVPFYVYAPEAISKKIPSGTFGSHIDIAPTLFNLALSNVNYVSLGNNLFENPDGTYAINNDGLILSKNGGVRVQPKGDIALKWDETNEHLIEDEMDEVIKKLSTKYKSLMGTLDLYLHEEKKNFETSQSR